MRFYATDEDLFFEYAEDYNERSLIIKPYGRLKTYEFE